MVTRLCSVFALIKTLYKFRLTTLVFNSVPLAISHSALICYVMAWLTCTFVLHDLFLPLSYLDIIFQHFKNYSPYFSCQPDTDLCWYLLDKNVFSLHFYCEAQFCVHKQSQTRSNKLPLRKHIWNHWSFTTAQFSACQLSWYINAACLLLLFKCSCC